MGVAGLLPRPISTADGLQGSPDDDGDGTAGPAMEPPLSPFSPGSSWSDRTVWRQWFDGMTNDLGEDDEDDLLESDEDDDGSQSRSSWSDDEPPSDCVDDATSSVTEASLSALYKCPVTVIPGFDSFDAIVLSQWDNVLGPQNKHVRPQRCPPRPRFHRAPHGTLARPSRWSADSPTMHLTHAPSFWQSGMDPPAARGSKPVQQAAAVPS